MDTNVLNLVNREQYRVSQRHESPSWWSVTTQISINARNSIEINHMQGDYSPVRVRSPGIAEAMAKHAIPSCWMASTSAENVGAIDGTNDFAVPKKSSRRKMIDRAKSDDMLQIVNARRWKYWISRLIVASGAVSDDLFPQRRRNDFTDTMKISLPTAIGTVLEVTGDWYVWYLVLYTVYCILSSWGMGDVRWLLPVQVFHFSPESEQIIQNSAAWKVHFSPSHAWKVKSALFRPPNSKVALNRQ